MNGIIGYQQAIAAQNLATRLKSIDLAGRRSGYLPTFTKPLTSPIMTIANQTITSMSWPWLIEVDEIFGGPGPYGENYRIYYGTDHSSVTSSTATWAGIALLTAASILGPWTDRGIVFRDTTGGSQTETPAVIYVPETQKFHLYYHQVGPTGGSGAEADKLATMSLATALVGDSWTIHPTNNGIIHDVSSWDPFGWPSSAGFGYMRPFRYGGRFYSHHTVSGTNYSRSALSQSATGLPGSWRIDPRPLSGNAHLIDSATACGTHAGSMIFWQGRLLHIGIAALYASGGAATSGVVVVAPASSDFRRYEAEPIPAFGYSQASWETDAAATILGTECFDFRSGISSIVAKDGKIYTVYQGAGAADLNTGSKAAGGAFSIAVGS